MLNLSNLLNNLIYRDKIKRLKEAGIYCLCCGCKTLYQKDNHEICPVCFWEDDLLDESGISGANGISLTQAKENFINFGACTENMLKNVLPKKIVVKYGRK